jgi:hypothetical protein
MVCHSVTVFEFLFVDVKILIMFELCSVVL